MFRFMLPTSPLIKPVLTVIDFMDRFISETLSSKGGKVSNLVEISPISRYIIEIDESKWAM